MITTILLLLKFNVVGILELDLLEWVMLYRNNQPQSGLGGSEEIMQG